MDGVRREGRVDEKEKKRERHRRGGTEYVDGTVS